MFWDLSFLKYFVGILHVLRFEFLKFGILKVSPMDYSVNMERKSLISLIFTSFLCNLFQICKVVG